jgi:hypothetical protein
MFFSFPEFKWESKELDMQIKYKLVKYKSNTLPMTCVHIELKPELINILLFDHSHSRILDK